MDWLSQNWIWLLFIGAMVVMHLFGHGGHGGHGDHRGTSTGRGGCGDTRSSETLHGKRLPAESSHHEHPR